MAGSRLELVSNRPAGGRMQNGPQKAVQRDHLRVVRIELHSGRRWGSSEAGQCSFLAGRRSNEGALAASACAAARLTDVLLESNTFTTCCTYIQVQNDAVQVFLPHRAGGYLPGCRHRQRQGRQRRRLEAGASQRLSPRELR